MLFWLLSSDFLLLVSLHLWLLHSAGFAAATGFNFGYPDGRTFFFHQPMGGRLCDGCLIIDFLCKHMYYQFIMFCSNVFKLQEQIYSQPNTPHVFWSSTSFVLVLEIFPTYI
ncbi:hypothetical protein ABFS82_04G003600 [Erythranthe guttata]